MGPLEPKAISLCFFSKLVLQTGVRVVRAPLPQCVVGTGWFCQGNTSKLATRCQISLLCMGKSPLQQPTCLLLLGFPRPAAKLLSSPQIGCDSVALAGGGGGTPRCWSPKLRPRKGFLRNFCPVVCWWEQPVGYFISRRM